MNIGIQNLCITCQKLYVDIQLTPNKRFVNTPKICALAVMTLSKIKVIIGKHDPPCQVSDD